MRKEIVLIGGGGHCRIVIDAIKNESKFSIHGVIDSGSNNNMASIMDVSVLGTDKVLPEIFKKGIRYAFISIGSIGDCSLRKRLYYKVKKIGFALPCIVHPKTTVAEGVSFGEGTFVAAGAVICPGTRIGKNVILNTSSTVDHDCKIGDFVHIAPGAILNGHVKVGDETHIGTGANVLQELNIGKRCMIAAGTTVRHDMPDDARNYGKYIAGSHGK